MTFTIDSTDLTNGFRQVKLGGYRGNAPVLMYGGGGSCTFAADSLDAKVTVTVPALDGSLDPVLVPYDHVARILSKYPAGPVRIVFDRHKLRFRSGRSTSGFATLDAEAFPRRPPLRPDAEVVELGEAWAGIRRVVPAADSTVIGWVRDLAWVNDHVYATDRYRVHRTKIDQALTKPIRLPGVMIEAMIRAKVDIDELSWDGEHFCLSGDTTTWTGRLGNPEEMLRVAPQIEKPFTIEPVCSFTANRKELIAALQRVMIIPVAEGQVMHEVAALHFDADFDSAMIVERKGEVGDHSEEVGISVEGNPLDIGFNGHNLIDSLGQLGGDDVTIHGPANPRMPWRMGDDQLEIAMMPVAV